VIFRVTFSDGSQRVVQAESYMDVRGYFIGGTVTEILLVEGNSLSPTVELRWVGSDFNKTGGRRQQVRARMSAQSEWDDWKEVRS
jgi:hypothetical protein